MDQTYVFVCGCPRSGTTALNHVFNWHPHVFMGIERFSARFARQPESFVPELFRAARFATFVAGDCGYNAFAELPEYGSDYSVWFKMPLDPAKIDDAPFVGDKITQLYRNFARFRSPPWAGRRIVMVQILRNLPDVARSYEKRKLDPNDRWDSGYAEAATEWSLAMEQGLALHRDPSRGMQHLLVNYENVFERGLDGFVAGCGKILAATGLDPELVNVQGLVRVFRNGERRMQKRGEGVEALTPEMILKLARPPALTAYEELRAAAVL